MQQWHVYLQEAGRLTMHCNGGINHMFINNAGDASRCLVKGSKLFNISELDLPDVPSVCDQVEFCKHNSSTDWQRTMRSEINFIEASPSSMSVFQTTIALTGAKNPLRQLMHP